MFEPSWTFWTGSRREHGNGLLHPSLWVLPSPDRFRVTLNGINLECFPKGGIVARNLEPVLNVSPGKLIWFRRIQMGLSTNGRMSMTKRCVFYGIGIENDSGRFGIRLYENGRVEQGLEK